MVDEPITIWDMYRRDPTSEIPESYRVIGFYPPAPRQVIWCVMGYIAKATAQFHELCPRLILKEIEPCELCGDKEPATLTEIKKSGRAKNYSLLLLCTSCIETNKKLIKT